MLQLEANYPNIVSTEIIGRSFEGRDLLLIRISSGGSNKPTIFGDAGIHAREWIAPSTALYVINQLVEVPENSYLYENVDWVFIPVANPDGYEYTHDVVSVSRCRVKTEVPNRFGVNPLENFELKLNGRLMTKYSVIIPENKFKAERFSKTEN